MAKKQTRKSVSMSGITYTKLKAHCADKQISVSRLIETLVASHLATATPVNTALAPKDPS